MKLKVGVSPMQKLWPGYKAWAAYNLVAPDGVIIACGQVKLSHLHHLTKLLLIPAPQGER